MAFIFRLFIDKYDTKPIIFIFVRIEFEFLIRQKNSTPFEFDFIVIISIPLFSIISSQGFHSVFYTSTLLP